MAEISLLSSFVFVMRVVVIFVDFVGNLSYNYASDVDFNSLRTWSPLLRRSKYQAWSTL